MNQKWRTVLILAAASCLAMSLWFSASAVTPALTTEWRLQPGDEAWLTMSVQLGFVFGALLSAMLNIADIFPARVVFACGALCGALVNGLIAAVIDSLAPALVLRFLTGTAIAFVYPVGMKILATWMRKDRGLGLGILVGALSVGSAFPHLMKVFGGISEWRPVLYASSLSAVAGAVLVLVWCKPGPYHTPTPPFHWRYVVEAFRDRGVRLANFGYFGHMWELYAMWTWIPVFILESFRTSGSSGIFGLSLTNIAAVLGFATIAIGGAGSVLAGYLADRWGRTRTTILSMAISGSCALVIGLFFETSPWAVAAISLVWGFAVVADSAQFSSSVSELCTREYMGTALTIQTSLGFLLTMVSIRMIPSLVDRIGWTWAFTTLTAGPLLGSWAMWRLLRSSDAVKLASGRG